MKFYAYNAATPLGSETMTQKKRYFKAKTIEEAIKFVKVLFSESAFTLYSYRDALRTDTFSLQYRNNPKKDNRR